MTQANSVPVEAKPDQDRDAETSAPAVKNTNGAPIRSSKRVAAQPVPARRRTKAKARKRTDAATVMTDSPESVSEPPKPAPRPKDGRGQYPEDTKLFEYQPASADAPKLGGSATIYIPLEFERPNKVWLWELNIQPFLSQTWAWLNRAGVPRVIQRQCVSLPDAEYMVMFNKWFEAMGGGATPGE